MSDRGEIAVHADDLVVSVRDVWGLKKRICDLERILGKSAV